jgi:hypothetical protein
MVGGTTPSSAKPLQLPDLKEPKVQAYVMRYASGARSEASADHIICLFASLLSNSAFPNFVVRAGKHHPLCGLRGGSRTPLM